MTFLYPVFLLGALAVAIPIVLHFMRRDVAPEVPFSAVRLLQRSPLQRSRRRRLRDLLLLAARVAALLLLATAFARPYVPGIAASASGVRIVAIDRSFSMGAPGRFRRALDLARAAIDEAGVSERVAVIAFDERADLISRPGSAADARAALAALAPGYAATRYGPVLAAAVEVADNAGGRLIVISDLQRAGWEAEQRSTLPASLQLEIRDVGAPPPNVGVAGVRVEKERLVVAVHNAGPAAKGGKARVLRDGRGVAEASYSAGADATVEVPIAFRPPASGALAIAVDDAAGFSADNVRYVLLDPTPRSRVLIVTTAAGSSGFYLARALGAAAEEEGAASPIDPGIMTGVSASAMAPQDLSEYDAVALLSTRGLDRRARDTLRGYVHGGGGLLVAAAPDVEAAVLSTLFDWQPALSVVDQPPKPVTLSATDLRHPIFRPFGALAANLGQVRFDRAWRLTGDGWDVAARFTDGAPALLERREGEGRVVLFASDLDRRWNEFPLNPAFVPFAVEAVRYVSRARDRDLTREFAVADAPEGVPRQPGVYQLPDKRTVIVNVDARESSTARLTAAEFEGMVDRIAAGPAARQAYAAQQVEQRQSYWQYGLLLMIAALVAESFVGRA